MIRKKYPDFKIMSTGKKKQNHNRKKYYIQPYVLFTNNYDDIIELERYVNVYSMIYRSNEAEECYKDLKAKLGFKKNLMRKFEKNKNK